MTEIKGGAVRISEGIRADGMMNKIYGLVAFLSLIAFAGCMIMVESSVDVSLLGMGLLMIGFALVHVGCVLKTGILTAEYEEQKRLVEQKRRSQNAAGTGATDSASNMALLQVACLHTVEHK